MNDIKTIKTDSVIFREDLYPRVKQDPALVQKYAADLMVLPPIEVNQRCELIDGWHRWTAHRKNEAEMINVFVTQTKSDVELLAIAAERNAKFGWQMDEASKKSVAIKLYAAGEGYDKKTIAKTLSISEKSIQRYLHDTDEQISKQRDEKILEMWLRCHTQEEIAAAVGLSQPTVKEKLEVLSELDNCPKSIKLAALFQDEFTAPIYNIWSFAKKTNITSHAGNTEQRITENLLYLYTKPFDIVVDPFAGGGSTLDVCLKRMRRCWCSDLNPIVERESDIRELDICADLPPLAKRWSEVSLTYLDPPYWRQVESQYSDDKADMANMPLAEFTEKIVGVVRRIADKQSKGAIALIIQPTQWKSEPKGAFTDHVFDIVQGAGKSKKLTLENRVSCPYSTEQYTPQMVDWAKENKRLLVLTRELILWTF